MKTFDLLISNSHYLIITEDGKHLLVDTGSPNSFSEGNCSESSFIGEDVGKIAHNASMIEEINKSGLIQEKIDALLGMDILSNHTIEFDKVGCKVIVDADVDECNYNHNAPLNILNVLGKMCVALDVDINGNPAKSILDTGAWISYLSSKHLNGIEASGPIRDYNPILGEINTTKHLISLSICDFSQDMEVAMMPKMLEMAMALMEVDLVIGLNAIECKRVCLDFRSNVILF